MFLALKFVGIIEHANQRTADSQISTLDTLTIYMIYHVLNEKKLLFLPHCGEFALKCY